MTLEEAKKISEKEKYAPDLIGIVEYPEHFVFSYGDKKRGAAYVSPLYVDKRTGETGVFFPPNYPLSYLNKGKKIL